MTGIGENARIYGEFSDIPDRFQPAIRAGINFFELRTEKPIMFDRQIQGPFSVGAREEFNSVAQRTEYIVDWQTGERASVRFEVVNPKTGLAKAFMPDDKFWHNRIMVCDNPSLQAINAYHTREGMFPGSMLLEEINLLYQLITVPSIEYTLFNAVNRPIGSFKTRHEAEIDMKDNNYKNHEIRERQIRVKSPAVMEMIKNCYTVTRSRFGWTDCPQFVEIQQECKRIIKERRGAAPVIQAAAPQLSTEELDARIVAAIRRMPIEERKKLIDDTTQDQVQKNVFDGKQTKVLTTPQLREKAIELGIKVGPRSTRLSMIKAIKEKGYELMDIEAEESREAARNEPVPQPDNPDEEEIVR